MSCCPGKAYTSCLGRCDLPKHRCLDKEEVKPGPVPSYMGWNYTAKDGPDHQLRCGWRPGHIACPVLRRIDQHNSAKAGECYGPCSSGCDRPPCSPSTRCLVTKCRLSSSNTSTCSKSPPCPSSTAPSIRIIRHGGVYTISTKPSDISNAPSGPYPLKYVLNADEDDTSPAKYSVEAKFNDYHFDYSSSQTSFILDFTPPDNKPCYKPCNKPCPKRSSSSLICPTKK